MSSPRKMTSSIKINDISLESDTSSPVISNVSSSSSSKNKKLIDSAQRLSVASLDGDKLDTMWKRDQMILNARTEDCQEYIECKVREEDTQAFQSYINVEDIKYQVYYITQGKSEYDNATGVMKNFGDEAVDSDLHSDAIMDCEDTNEIWYTDEIFTEANSIVLSSPFQACIQTVSNVTGNRSLFVHPALASGAETMSNEVNAFSTVKNDMIDYSTYAGSKGPRPYQWAHITKQLFDNFWLDVLDSEPVKALTGENRYIIIGGHADWLCYMAHDLDSIHHKNWNYLARVHVPYHTIIRFVLHSKDSPSELIYSAPSIAHAMYTLPPLTIGNYFYGIISKNVAKMLNGIKSGAAPAHNHADYAKQKTMEVSAAAAQSAKNGWEKIKNLNKKNQDEEEDSPEKNTNEPAKNSDDDLFQDLINESDEEKKTNDIRRSSPDPASLKLQRSSSKNSTKSEATNPFDKA